MTRGDNSEQGRPYGASLLPIPEYHPREKKRNQRLSEVAIAVISCYNTGRRNGRTSLLAGSCRKRGNPLKSITGVEIWSPVSIRDAMLIADFKEQEREKG